MHIEFMFNSIKDISLIYLKEVQYNKEWGGECTSEKYLGDKYSKDTVMKLKEQCNEIKKYNYNGQIGRIAKEEYCIETKEEKYALSFTFDTFEEDKKSRLFIKLYSQSNKGKYDISLEKIKIKIKEILLKDWEMCTWIIDEQSESLGMDLYPLIFKTENKMRGFINQVLTYKFGVKWMELSGFESIIKSYKKNNVVFKREVPEFNNINDVLICSTAELLTKLMLESKIFEPTLNIVGNEFRHLYKLLEDKSIDSLVDKLRNIRKVKVDIWQDIFEQYFDDSIKNSIKEFIKNRNHVAHNKLLTNAAFNKMRENILKVERMFNQANELFLNEEPSNELTETLQIEYEDILAKEKYVQDRIKNEAGINVLFSDEIFNVLEQKIYELYTEIDDLEYFSNGVSVSDLNNIQDKPEKQILFSVKSNVDSSFDFNICVLLDIVEAMEEDSSMNLWIEKSDMIKMLNTKVVYHNGSAYEHEGYYMPESESYFEDERLKSFIKDLKNYINDDMNTLKAQVDNLYNLHIKDGESLPVADCPCCSCNQNYISIDNQFYTYGHCVNCGEENTILECFRCGIVFSEEDGEEFCNYCLEEIKI